MTKFFLEILDYHHQLNKELIAQVTKFGMAGDISRLFSHMLNAHNIWNARMKGIGVTITAWEVHSLEAWSIMNEMNYNMTTEILKDAQLDNVIDYKDLSGNAHANSIQDILFHLLNHHTHHRAQIVASLREQGYEPMDTDYISRKR